MPKPPSSKVGCIPEKLRVIARYEMELTKTVDGNEVKVKVVPCLFQDVRTDKTAAMRWGTTNRETSPPGTSYGERTWEKVDPTASEESNSPITNLRFWCIEERSEGGRAYKVIDEHGRLFDMREDVVEESFHYDEFRKGIFKGKYVWGKCGSQMRLVRVKSKLYDGLYDAGRRAQLKKIPNKELEVGVVYGMKNGDKLVYLGRTKGQGMRFCTLSTVRRGEEEPKDLQKFYDNMIERSKEGYNRFHFSNAQSLVEKLGTVNTRGFEI